MDEFRWLPGQLLFLLLQYVAFADPDVVSSPAFSSASFPSDVVLGLLSLSEDDEHISHIETAIEDLAVNRTLVGGARVRVVKRVTNGNVDSVSLSLQVCSFLAAGTSAIMTTTPCHVTQQLYSFTAQMGILAIDALGRACDYETDVDDDSTLSDGMFQTLASLMLKEHWNDVVVFFDSEYEPSIQWLVDALSRRGIRTTLFNVTARNATLLQKYREVFIQFDHFVVLCSHEGVRWTIDMARFGYLDILGPKYKWIMADNGRLEPDALLDLLIEGDNVAVVAKRHELEEETSAAVNLSVQGLIESVEDLMSRGEFTLPVPTCKDVGRLPWPTGERLINIYVNQSKHEKVPSTPIVDIYTLAPHVDGTLTWAKIGYWYSNQSLALNDYLFPEVHHGFNNRTFIVTTLPYPPFIVRYDNGSYDGICFEILHELQRVLNFSYRVVEPEDRRWGGKLSPGNFSGMIGLIRKKRADFGVGIFGVNSDRQEAVDFTTPFMVDPSIVLLRKPDLASSQLFICLGPFSTVVWFLIALSVLLTGTILWLLVWYHPLHERQWKGIRPVGIYNPKIVVWQTFGALMQQGMVYIPTSHSARVVIAAWWFYIIVVVGTYNGNLIAFLTAPKLTTPVNSLTELSTSGMKYGFLRDSMLHGVFSSASGLYEEMWEVLEGQQDEYLVDDNIDGMARALRDPSYGFLLEKSFYDTLPNKNATFRNESCAFARAKQSFLATYYAFPFQKNSPYTRQFSLGILRLLEAGLIQRWQRKWYAVAHRCTGLERTTSQTNISLAEAQGAFYILAIGLICASLALLAEKIWRQSNSLKRRGAVKRRDNERDEKHGYHVGSMPSIGVSTDRSSSKTDDIMNVRELQESFASPTFNPYVTDFRPQKLRKIKRFPNILSACCEPKANDDDTEWGKSNGAYDMYSSKGSSIFSSSSRAVAWYDTNGRTLDITGNPLRHNGTLDKGYFKDAETGEFSSVNRRRK